MRPGPRAQAALNRLIDLKKEFGEHQHGSTAPSEPSERVSTRFLRRGARAKARAAPPAGRHVGAPTPVDSGAPTPVGTTVDLRAIADVPGAMRRERRHVQVQARELKQEIASARDRWTTAEQFEWEDRGEYLSQRMDVLDEEAERLGFAFKDSKGVCVCVCV